MTKLNYRNLSAVWTRSEPKAVTVGPDGAGDTFDFSSLFDLPAFPFEVSGQEEPQFDHGVTAADTCTGEVSEIGRPSIEDCCFQFTLRALNLCGEEE